MRTNNLYEAIIDFCRIMAIFILFSIIVNLFSSCESVEEMLEEKCGYVEYSVYDQTEKAYETKIFYDSEAINFDIILLKSQAEVGQYICHTY